MRLMTYWIHFCDESALCAILSILILNLHISGQLFTSQYAYARFPPKIMLLLQK